MDVHPRSTRTSASSISLASLNSLVFLIFSRLVSLRMLLGLIGALLAASFFSETGIELDGLTKGYFLFIVIFLACDPASSACTNSGRWANGMLSGFLVWAFTSSGGTGFEVQTLISAIFLGSLFAPLIDRIVVEFNVYMRSRRHG